MLKVERVEQEIHLTGTLALETAKRAFADSERWLTSDVQSIDLSGVDNADSVAVALMVEWQRGRPDIRFTGVPGSLRAVARLSDLEAALNLPPTPPT